MSPTIPDIVYVSLLPFAMDRLADNANNVDAKKLFNQAKWSRNALYTSVAIAALGLTTGYVYQDGMSNSIYSFGSTMACLSFCMITRTAFIIHAQYASKVKTFPPK